MFSSIKLNRGNKLTQVYCHPTRWVRVFPMRWEREAHESLSVLFKRDGVPIIIWLWMVLSHKYKVISRRNAKDQGVILYKLNPIPLGSTHLRLLLRCLSKHQERTLDKKKCPKVLLDDCIKRQSYIRSFTAHNNYAIKGECLETLINGETPDISAFGEYDWYYWVKYRDTQVVYPEENFVLGRCLCPSFDVGPAMIAKILKKNGEYIHSSTLRHLTSDE